MPLTPPRSQPRNAARTQPAAARHVSRLDTQRFDPTGADLLRFDPLATMPPEPKPTAHAALPVDLGEILAEPVDTQGRQLRQAVEVAGRLERVLSGRTVELAQRLEQSSRFTQEMDRRLIAAGSAVGVLDRATTVLKGLEATVAQLREVRAEQQRWITERLESQRQECEKGVAASEAATTARLQQSSQRLDEMIGALDQRITTMGATLERQAAAAAARVSVLLDDAQQRLVDMEAESTRIGAQARERVEKVCETAAAVLGHDPRFGDGNGAAVGSLQDIVERLEAAVKQSDQALLRLNVLTERATDCQGRLEASIAQAREFDESQARLRESLAKHAESEARLTSLRDDLESVAASARYNLSQAQQADSSLKRTAELAASSVNGLERAMSDATEQAAGLVQVARDVGGLLLQARECRQELVTVIERAQPGRTAAGAKRLPLAGKRTGESDADSVAA